MYMRLRLRTRRDGRIPCSLLFLFLKKESQENETKKNDVEKKCFGSSFFWFVEMIR